MRGSGAFLCLVPCGCFVSLLPQDCPFIVCMTYAFHTPDKLCFILDLMNGKPSLELIGLGELQELAWRPLAQLVPAERLGPLPCCLEEERETDPRF